jgi:hypothetical protein
MAGTRGLVLRRSSKSAVTTWKFREASPLARGDVNIDVYAIADTGATCDVNLDNSGEPLDPPIRRVERDPVFGKVSRLSAEFQRASQRSAVANPLTAGLVPLPLKQAVFGLTMAECVRGTTAVFVSQGLCHPDSTPPRKKCADEVGTAILREQSPFRDLLDELLGELDKPIRTVVAQIVVWTRKKKLCFDQLHECNTIVRRRKFSRRGYAQRIHEGPGKPGYILQVRLEPQRGPGVT